MGDASNKKSEIVICRRCYTAIMDLGSGAGKSLSVCSCGGNKAPLIRGHCLECGEITTDGPYLGFSNNHKAAKPVTQIGFIHERCYYLHILRAEDILQKRLKEKPRDNVAKKALEIFSRMADRICSGEKLPRHRYHIIKK